MEQKDMVDLWRKASRRGELVFVATIVHVEGSSYRKPGARMVVTGGGERAGMISGGCLEAEVAKKIAWLTRDGAVVQSYLASFEENGSQPYGSGCGGTVWLLMEAGDRAADVLQAMADACERRASSVALYELTDGMSVSIHRPDGPDFAQAMPDALRARALQKSLRSGDVVPGPPEQTAALPAFVCVPTVPPPQLFVFGAGDDARPLVAMASQLGWHATVADGRLHLLREERFPTAWRFERLHYASQDESNDGFAGDLAHPLVLGERDLAVVLTHSFEQDRAILKSLLKMQPLYIGVLGPRQRTGRLLESIVGPSPEAVVAAFDRIYSPVGLSIGAKDPATIALSILAEMQAKLAGKVPMSEEERMPRGTAASTPVRRALQAVSAADEAESSQTYDGMATSTNYTRTELEVRHV